MDGSMTITITENGIRVLTPDEGKYLTNGETYSEKVFLGKDASTDDWTEVDTIPEESNDTDATEADYLEALAELGVSE